MQSTGFVSLYAFGGRMVVNCVVDRLRRNMWPFREADREADKKVV